jgi:hypothetical protein
MPNRISRTKAVGLSIGTALVMSTAWSLVSVAGPANAAAVDCPTEEQIPAEDLQSGENAAACDLIGRVVLLNDLSVYVPDPGEGITAQAESATGEDATSLTVETSLDGTVTAVIGDVPDPGSQNPDPAVGTDSSGASEAFEETDAVTEVGEVVDPDFDPLAVTLPRACRMSEYNFLGHMWDANETAKFLVNNTEARPSNITAAKFLAVAKAAASHISGGHNDCDIASNPAINIAFSALTTYNSNINGAENRCAADGDGRNTVDFGNLTSFLALTCTRHKNQPGWTYRKITESDIRMDNTSVSWVTTTSGCTGNKYDMEAVATHEFGHWVGMGHVADDGDSDLTMSVHTASCNASARTLGKGDLKGLKVPY